MIEEGKFICSHMIQNPHSNSRVLIVALFVAHKILFDPNIKKKKKTLALFAKQIKQH